METNNKFDKEQLAQQWNQETIEHKYKENKQNNLQNTENYLWWTECVIGA